METMDSSQEKTEVAGNAKFSLMPRSYEFIAAMGKSEDEPKPESALQAVVDTSAGSNANYVSQPVEQQNIAQSSDLDIEIEHMNHEDLSATDRKNEQRRKRYREAELQCIKPEYCNNINEGIISQQHQQQQQQQEQPNGQENIQMEYVNELHQEKLEKRRIRERMRYSNMSEEERSRRNTLRRKKYRENVATGKDDVGESRKVSRREKERMRYHSLDEEAKKERNDRRAKMERERYNKMTQVDRAERNRKRRDKDADRRKKKMDNRRIKLVENARHSVDAQLNNPNPIDLATNQASTEPLSNHVKMLGLGEHILPLNYDHIAAHVNQTFKPDYNTEHVMLSGGQTVSNSEEV